MSLLFGMKLANCPKKRLFMNNNIHRSMICPALLLTFATGAVGQIVNVGGPLRHGEARPPLYMKVLPSTTSSSAPPYTPVQVRHAYGFDKLSVTGVGKTIAIVDAYGSRSLQNDFNLFCSTFGLPAQNIQVVLCARQAGDQHRLGARDFIGRSMGARDCARRHPAIGRGPNREPQQSPGRG
jgi:hypothetical protein